VPDPWPAEPGPRRRRLGAASKPELRGHRAGRDDHHPMSTGPEALRPPRQSTAGTVVGPVRPPVLVRAASSQLTSYAFALGPAGRSAPAAGV
jgi:hypothetical protein